MRRVWSFWDEIPTVSEKHISSLFRVEEEDIEKKQQQVTISVNLHSQKNSFTHRLCDLHLVNVAKINKGMDDWETR
jgi:hypothetical protein